VTIWETFGPATITALFEAVDTDDVVDPVVSLPDPILLDCSDDEIRRCYALCLQFWKIGVHRGELRRLATVLLKDGDLSQEDRATYKHIRAAYKQLRFALTLYGERHAPPRLFARTVLIMGRLQDAFRFGDRREVTRNARILRLLASWPAWRLVLRSVETLHLASAARFLAYRQAEFRTVRATLQHELLTGDEFHDMRKIISREVSFHDTLRSIQHRDDNRRLSRYLSAINGLMGRRHDEMVALSISGERHYDTPAALDPDLRRRLEDLIARYPM
jgi:hypothetical protein